MDWGSVDERLVKRGELLLSLEFLEGYSEELKAMNHGKVGRPFTLTYSRMTFLAVVRTFSGFHTGGFTRALNRLIPRLPSADHSGLRRHAYWRWIFRRTRSWSVQAGMW